MKPPNYFEGILQLREVSQEVVDFVEDACIGSDRGQVAKVKKVKNGFDFYMQSNPFLRQLAKKIKENFSGELVTTATLHTRDTKSNKDLYRVTVMFRELPVKKGDTFTLNGDEFEVLGVSEKILARDLKTKKKKQFRFSELRKAAFDEQ